MMRPTDSPVMPEKNAQASAPPTTSGIRFERSANWAIGTCNASAATDDNATIDNVVVQIEVEGFTDVGEQDAECRPVEFVDRVQSEQDEQRECGLAAADAAQPVHRVGHPVAEPPPHRRVVDRGGVACPSGSAVAGAVTSDSVRR